jgi:hypothetical protein
MLRNKRVIEHKLLAPTPEDVEISRKRIQDVLDKARSRQHPFTKNDFEAFAPPALRPAGKRRQIKESA